MALKDWRRQDVGTIGNTTNIIWWEKKGSRNSDLKLELFKAPSREGKPWGVDHDSIVQRNFKTRSQAMNFAKSFMSSN